MVPYNETLITEKFQIGMTIIFPGSPRERLRLIADNRLEIKPSVLDHQQAENRT
ncbi:hypothetical protein ALC57_18200 [Trachymyrmex cornetzi]|uniref:Uncharacterized protein n=1 Tax=Trachymyrmex cornetzi TaxID=471704 RepID=A0A195DB86_9HYME|nr:hypothetical protein ALC57_18200 [Trachymyrmex cornetzi]